MIYQTVADILAANEQAQSRFIETVEHLSEPQLNFRPTGESWTIAEIAEHLSIVNEGFLRITHKLLKQSEAAGRPAKPTKNELNLNSVLLDGEGRQNPTKFPAPDRVKPQGDVSLDEALSKMRATLDGFTAIHDRIEATDLSEEKFPHPAMGELNAYQWMIVQHEHQDRHREQIERIKASDGFPQ